MASGELADEITCLLSSPPTQALFPSIAGYSLPSDARRISTRVLCHMAGLGWPAAPSVARLFVGLSRFNFCRAHELDRDFTRGPCTRLRSGLSAALCAFIDSY